MNPAVNLLNRMLEAARAGRVRAEARHDFNAEAEALGPESMAEARRIVGEEREKMRAANLTNPSEQACSEVAS